MRALITAALLLAPTPAWSQPACRVTVSGLDFGIYSTRSTAPRNNIGAVDVACAGAVATAISPRVTITAGNSGNYLDRVMLSGADELHYNLYADIARTLVLGDGSSGTVPFPPPRVSSPGRARFVIFGTIQPRQLVPAGSYSDTLLIQVEF